MMPTDKQLHLCERMYNLEIAAHFQTSSELGGDAWGMQPLSESRMALWCYDFSGHGMLAAMNVFRMHAIMQECLQYAAEPGHYLMHLNKRLCGLLDKHEFATMFYGVIDVESNCLLYASAAAPQPILSIEGDRPFALPTAGLPLAVLQDAIYETQYAPFPANALFMLYSDGLIETPDSNGQMISESMLFDCMTRTLSGTKTPAASMKNDVLGLLGERQNFIKDDITLALFHRL
ncbi:MAG: PP2C family protein-serine/threonine phosphatase [Alphaproteobacteria bacterium]|nr:PP2C family protein-serine/threonine phosphatase [Alphaproteobacteria bacterium]